MSLKKHTVMCARGFPGVALFTPIRTAAFLIIVALWRRRIVAHSNAPRVRARAAKVRDPEEELTDEKDGNVRDAERGVICNHNSDIIDRRQAAIDRTVLPNDVL